MKKIFIVFLLLLIPSSVTASSWNDVIISWGSQPVEQGCFNFVEKYNSGSGTGFKIWKRCNGDASVSYIHKELAALNANHEIAGCCAVDTLACNGTSSLISPNGQWMWYWGSASLQPGYTQTLKTVYCDGMSAVDQSTGGTSAVPVGMLTSPCNLGYPTNNTQNGLCALSDVLVDDFPVVTDDCQYVGLQIETPGGWSTTSYKSLVTDTSTQYPCNQCIPAGTIPDDTYTNFGLPQDGDPEGRIACYYKDVTGDPAKLADTYTPPANGGGGAGNVGAPVVQPNTDTTTTTEVISDGQGNSETLVTTTTTTTDGSGNSTTESTTQLSNCIDANGDGISDISGRKCGQSQTTSTSGVTTPAASQPVNPYGAFAGKSFADVWTAHSTVWMDTQVVGLINDMNVTLNKSLPCYPFNLGSWGNAGQFCLSDYAWIFDIIYYLNLLCAVFISRFIIFG